MGANRFDPTLRRVAGIGASFTSKVRRQSGGNCRWYWAFLVFDDSHDMNVRRESARQIPRGLQRARSPLGAIVGDDQPGDVGRLGEREARSRRL